MPAKLTPALTQFNNGLVNAELEARTDLAVYPYSCRQLENASVLLSGAVNRRGGTAFAAQTRENQPAVLIPFRFNRTVAYMLEFTDGYLRVYKNHALVRNEDGSVYETASPYSYQQLVNEAGQRAVSYQQINDVVYLACADQPLQKLMRYADTDWRFETVVLKGGPFEQQNSNNQIYLKADGTKGNVTVTSNMGGTLDLAQMYWSYSGTFVSSPEGFSHGIDGRQIQCIFEGKVICSYGNGADGQQNNYNDLIKAMFESMDVGITVRVTSGTYETLQLIDTSKEHIYSGKSITFLGNRHRHGGHDDGWGCSGTYTFGEVRDNALFSEEDIGRLIRLTAIADNTQYWYAGRGGITVGTVLKHDGKYYEAQNSGTCGNVEITHEEGTESDGSILWKYLHAGYGWGTITQFIDAQTVNVFLNENLPDMPAGTWKWEKGVLGGRVHPRAVMYFKDRLVLGINDTDGTKLAFSATGDYENFADNEFGEVTPGCGFCMNLLTELSEICWLEAVEDLYVGTQGSVLVVKAMTTTQVFGPENVSYNVLTCTGCAPLEAVVRGSGVLFLGTHGKAVYDLAGVIARETADPDEITLLGSRVLEQGIKSWALAYEPQRMIWMIDNEGSLIGLTYDRTQQVRALSKHTTAGTFMCVAVIPSPDGQTDEPWFVVKRANGYFVEYLREGLPVDKPAGMTAKERQAFLRTYAFYLDCAKQQTFENPVSEIEGLEHLEGCEVDVFADGYVFGPHVVQYGRIVLPAAVTVATVGLRYSTVFEPMPLNIDANGTGNGRSYRINHLTLRLLNTGAAACGPREEVMDRLCFRRPGEPENFPLKSGDFGLTWRGNNTHGDITAGERPNTSGARMLFKSDAPLPMTICALYPSVEVSND